MKKFFKEFKEFINRGNVVDMAVGIIIGGAFGAIVTSLLNDIIMPLIGLLFKADFTNWGVILSENPGNLSVGEAAEAGLTVLHYGNFISVVLNFIIIALVVFLIIKAINKLKRPKEEAPAEPDRICPFCKQVIDKEATRCPHCTSELPVETVE